MMELLVLGGVSLVLNQPFSFYNFSENYILIIAFDTYQKF